ncbi:MAG TPA: hypothetical protein VFV95_04450 [Vicinamibacterales bacterium]|nr:hypothetical protein [Vicinamibacterales bacterium]
MGSISVLVCALELLGRSAVSMPPIKVLATPPAGVSVNAEAFVRADEGIIYVLAPGAAYRHARCDERRSLVKLASVLVHEEWHIRHGADERGAYEAQLGTLLRLGMQPDSAVYIGVVRSMNWVLKARERDAANARRAAATSDRAIADAGPVPSPGR